jgi:hypothetical protein
LNVYSSRRPSISWIVAPASDRRTNALQMQSFCNHMISAALPDGFAHFIWQLLFHAVLFDDVDHHVAVALVVIFVGPEKIQAAAGNPRIESGAVAGAVAAARIANQQSVVPVQATRP